jgi:hypothetical protein
MSVDFDFHPSNDPWIERKSISHPCLCDGEDACPICDGVGSFSIEGNSHAINMSGANATWLIRKLSVLADLQEEMVTPEQLPLLLSQIEELQQKLNPKRMARNQKVMIGQQGCVSYDLGSTEAEMGERVEKLRLLAEEALVLNLSIHIW